MPRRFRVFGSHRVIPANHSGPWARSETSANTSRAGRSISTFRERRIIANGPSQDRQDAFAGKSRERLLHPGGHVVVGAVVVVAEPFGHVDRREDLDADLHPPPGVPPEGADV